MEIKLSSDQQGVTANGEKSAGQGGAGNGKGNNGHLVHFKVDGEQYTSADGTMTPDYIMQHFAGKDPSSNYLVRIEGHDKVSYQNIGNDPIEVHNGWRFQVISLGPTTVSDGNILTGTERFKDELRRLGYEPISVPDHNDHVVISYEIETGKFSGQQIRLGWIVPPDFPMSCPTGPMISPHLRPVGAGGQHPEGGIHLDHAAPFAKGLTGDWQYWSRPFPGWQESKKTVAAYLSHIWQLMDSQ